MTYAALEATLEEYVSGRAAQNVPVARMMAMALDEIERRAETLAAALSNAGLQTEIVDGFSTVGGGSAPGSQLPTRLVALTLPAAARRGASRRPTASHRAHRGRSHRDRSSDRRT